MRKSRSIMGLSILAVILSVSLVVGSVSAEQKEEPKVTGSASAAFLSQYIFRGYELSSHSMVIQPAINLSYYGFSAGLWGNLDTKQTPTQNFFPGTTGNSSWNETDLTLSYTYVIDKLSLTGGYIWYGTQYTNQTQELFVAAAYDIISKPVLTIYQDIDNYSGTYFQLALSHSLPVYKDITFDMAASFSYMWGQGGYWKTFQSSTGAYTGDKYSAFHAGMLQGGVTIPVTKTFSVQPVLQWWFPLSGDASKTINGVSYNPNGKLDDTVVFGLNMTFNF